MLFIDRRFVFAGIFCTTLLGCGSKEMGPPTAHLQGKVTIGGQPIAADAEGFVTFRPTGNGQANSANTRIAGGRYDAEKVPLGKVKVIFDVQQKTGKMISGEGVAPFPEYRSLVPPQSSTGIDLEVNGDKADQNFDL